MTKTVTITWEPVAGSNGTLVEFRKVDDPTWTTPVSPANPTILTSYPIVIETGFLYYVRLTTESVNCSTGGSEVLLVGITTSTTSTSTTSTTTTSTTSTTTSSTTTTTTTVKSFTISPSYGMTMSVVSGTGVPVFTLPRSTPQTLNFTTPISGNITVTLTGTPIISPFKLDLYLNNVLITTLTGLTGAGTYTVPVTVGTITNGNVFLGIDI